MVRLRDNPNPRTGCVHGASDGESWVLELRKVVWGKPLYRTDGPSIWSATEEAVAGILPSVHTPLKWCSR